MKFTQLINESESNILYHRSEHEFKDGEILNANFSLKYKNEYEIALEQYRKINYPDKPSRRKCFYLSPTDKSRFHDRGFLYQVKPLGVTHITNSNIIDSLGDAFYDKNIILESKLIKEYWNPGNKWVNKSYIRNIEILCDKIQIISKINKKNELFKNDKLKCIKDFEHEIETYRNYPYTIQIFQSAIDRNIINTITDRKFIIKKNSIWEISEINKSKDFILNKKDGNIWGIDLVNKDFEIELIYGEGEKTNLNKFLKEHFIKL